jgi:hypothetical protein
MMVVAFGRANFQMEEDLVSIALEAAIGGSCGNLKVSLIKDRVFSFCVANKNVGFHILKLRRFLCQQFKCYFFSGVEEALIGSWNSLIGRSSVMMTGPLLAPQSELCRRAWKLCRKRHIILFYPRGKMLKRNCSLLILLLIWPVQVINLQTLLVLLLRKENALLLYL